MKKKDAKNIPSTIISDGVLFKYTLRISYKSKYIRITIDDKKDVILTVPYYVPITEGENFLKKKIPWLKKKINQIDLKMENIEDYRGEVWKKILFLGKEYTIDIVFIEGEKTGFFLENNLMIFYVQKDDIPIRNQIITILTETAQRELYFRTVKLSEIMDLSFNKITVKDQKTLWGSCSPDNNLNFNWRLIMCPLPVLEYIIIHELAHITVKNHSKRFWNIVTRFCPEYKLHQRWLREHHHLLRV
ncbi:MAG: M48 family metallopeptidase [bacterium]|nr:M48 family metallopeptidase [bacterium]